MTNSGWLRSLRRSAAVLALFLVVTPVALADAGPDHKLRQGRPVQLGTSGGNINDFARAFCYGGTLGSLVQDTGLVQYILSNNHVLARTNKAALGEDIIQPGLIDVRCQKILNDVVADLSAFVPLKFKSKTQVPLNTVDAAIAQVRSGAVASDGAILDIGTLGGPNALDTVNCSVQKSGRTTGITAGSISSVNVTVDVNYGSGKIARFVDQFLVTPGSFSAGGDSGSLIATTGTNTTKPSAAGLLFAGSSDYTVGNPIQAVQEALGVTMVSSDAGTSCPPETQSTTVASAAKGRHEAALMNLPDVVGVGVGVGGAIEVYLARASDDARRRIPSHVDNVPVRVIVTGPFEAR